MSVARTPGASIGATGPMMPTTEARSGMSAAQASANGATGGAEHGEPSEAQSLRNLEHIARPVNDMPVRREVRKAHSGAVRNDHPGVEFRDCVRRQGEGALDARARRPMAVEDWSAVRAPDLHVCETTTVAQANPLRLDGRHVYRRGRWDIRPCPLPI